MDERSESESPYHQWLQIPLELCPPNHYQLLGVDDFETDEEAMAAAAKERSAYLHQIAGGPSRKEIQKLLGEVAVAKRVLLNPEARADYNDRLNAPDEAEPEPDLESHQATQSHPAAVAKAPKKKLKTRAPKSDASKATPANSGTKSAGDAGKKQAGDAKKATSYHRKKKSAWDEYKLHAISASILLGIVGVFYFVNRGGGGGRRAANPVSSATAGAGFSAPRKPKSPRTQSLAAKSGNRIPNDPKPAARKAGAGPRPTRQAGSSGLIAPDIPGQNAPMAPNDGEPNDGEPNKSKPNAGKPAFKKKAPNGGKPDTKKTRAERRRESKAREAKAAKQKPPSNYTLPVNWRSRLTLVDDLKAGYQNEFILKGPDESKLSKKLSNSEDGLKIEPGAHKQIILNKKDDRLKIGEAVAVDIRLDSRRHPANVAGVGVGPTRVAVRSAGSGYDVLAKSTAGGSIKKADSVAGKGTNLTIVMIRENKDLVRWVVDTGGEVKSGVIDTKTTADGVAIHLFFDDTLKPSRQNVWFSNFRHGSL